MIRKLGTLALCFVVLGAPALGQVRSKAAREAAEYVLERFGVEAGEETVETLSHKIGQYGVTYGEEAIEAIRRTGPRSFQLIDNAGANAPAVVQLLNRYGNDAVWVASKPRNLAIFVRHGDVAAEAMIKHPGVVVPVVEEFGAPAARALRAVSEQNARRLAMLADDGSLTATGKASEILDVVGKYGDRAADWIWRNKGALAVASVAAAFIADPEPFLDGAVQVADIGAETLARPIAEKAAESINWNLVVAGGIALVALLVVVRFGWRWVLPRRTPLKSTVADSADSAQE